MWINNTHKYTTSNLLYFIYFVVSQIIKDLLSTYDDLRTLWTKSGMERFFTSDSWCFKLSGNMSNFASKIQRWGYETHSERSPNVGHWPYESLWRILRLHKVSNYYRPSRPGRRVGHHEKEKTESYRIRSLKIEEINLPEGWVHLRQKLGQLSDRVKYSSGKNTIRGAPTHWIDYTITPVWFPVL